ncbi:MAG: DUF4294 domain-containing protein [Rikenellaceae bacterium]
MLRTLTLILFAFFLLSPPTQAQVKGKSYYATHWEVSGGDSMMVVNIVPIPVYKRKADLRRYYKLIYNLKKVYPVAKFAREKLQETEKILATTPDKKEQRRIIKDLEKQLVDEYTPVLKKMTFSQGKILLKLIDRETGRSSYAILKELKGGFTAFFWQSIARLFSSDLKETYNKDGEDKIIEQLIIYYEAGLL